jgi:radical SAM superfamily enzyme with C-terminal helix-hairpin-helix motif
MADLYLKNANAINSIEPKMKLSEVYKILGEPLRTNNAQYEGKQYKTLEYDDVLIYVDADAVFAKVSGSKNSKKAKVQFQKLIDMDYNDPIVYLLMANIF